MNIKRPITVEVKVPDENFGYTEADSFIVGEAVSHALRDYVLAGGELDSWAARAEVYELSEGSGVRIFIEGQHRDQIVSDPMEGITGQ